MKRTPSSQQSPATSIRRGWASGYLAVAVAPLTPSVRHAAPLAFANR
jgi:hypothetical protein